MLEISFRNASGWKTTDGREVQNFELAGKDGKFYPAQAEISGKNLKVTSPEVSEPQTVRYLFDSGKMGNLICDTGLPPGIFELKVK